MHTFNAILYGIDLPVAGSAVIASFVDNKLSVNTPAIEVNCADITMRIGGFEHDNFFLNWHDVNASAYSLKPASRDDIKFVMAHAPPVLKQQFSQWHRRRNTIRLVWSTLASLALISVLSIILLWWQYDAVVSWVADQISIKHEVQLGNSVLEKIQADGEIIKTGAAVETISKIGRRLSKDSAYQYQWYIQKDKSVNAFALPGGIIIINSALIEKVNNADEIAAVLAHEIQHVEQRHSLKGMIHSLGWAAGLMIVLGDVNAAAAIVIHQMGVMYFGRDIEDEADRLGYQTLVRANVQPQGMVSLLQILEKQAGGKAPEWLSSHPDINKRIQNIEQLIKEQPCTSCESLNIDLKQTRKDIAAIKNTQT
jgi:beta-barrel assembly-enhancing protease